MIGLNAGEAATARAGRTLFQCVGHQTLERPRLMLRCGQRYQPVGMVDVERKKSILKAEREFERKENLSRALAERGVTLIGKVTSPAHPELDPPRPDETDL